MRCMLDIKKYRIKINKRLLADLIQRPIADCFAGKPKRIISGEEIGIKFNYICMYVQGEDDLDDPACWVHELVEHAISKILLKMLIEEGLTFHRIRNIICDGVVLVGIDGKFYNPKIKHVMASLCTNSVLDGEGDVTPDEFARFFRF